MGSDFSGTVISFGAGVTRVRPGDGVFGLARTNGVFLDIDPNPVKFLRSFMNRKLKRRIGSMCSAATLQPRRMKKDLVLSR
jgi:NADPH:quinone reductase-like Zn-dependent oxidoreductase